MANFLIDYLPNTGKTNEEIADALGYKRPNIVSMWKTGRTKVTLDTIWQLHKILNVDVAYLMVLYFEQYAGDAYDGTDHFSEIMAMMTRICTPEEWDIIRTVREARHHHSVPLKSAQKVGLKALFKLDASVGEGPLKEIELNFASSGDRRTFARRGYSRDMSIDEIEDTRSMEAEKSKPKGPIRKAGSRAPT